MNAQRKVVRVGAHRLRAIFNEGRYYEQAQRGELQVLTRRQGPAPAKAGQPPGTMSELLDYYNGSTRVATVHQYRRPDDSLGASGLPDPKAVLKEDVLYLLRR